MHRFVSYLSDDDFKSLRIASTRGKLNAMEKYQRDIESGEITLWTRSPKSLFEQLDRAIDFGAITAREAFDA